MNESRLLSNLNLSMDDDEFSDLLITCRGHEFRVHRLIVCAQSSFFRKACLGGFKESVTNTIDLEDDPETLRRMLSYMYTHCYEIRDTNIGHSMIPDLANDTAVDKNPTEQSHLSKPSDLDRGIEHMAKHKKSLFDSIAIYAIAEKYEVQPLKELARNKFAEVLDNKWMPEDIPRMIAEVFQSTPPNDAGLRDVVADMLANHVPKLLKDKTCREILQEFGELTLMVLTRFGAEQERVKLDFQDQVNLSEGRIQSLEGRVQFLEVYIETLKQLVQVSEGQTQNATRANDNLTKQIETLRRDKEVLDESARAVQDRLSKYKYCRHCDMGFGARIDSSKPNALRCVRCRTRHV